MKVCRYGCILVIILIMAIFTMTGGLRKIQMVKRAFREGKNMSLLEILTKKHFIPLDLEIRENVRSRSAKLRVAERT